MIESSADDYNDWRCSSTIDARAALLKEARETIIEAKKNTRSHRRQVNSHGTEKSNCSYCKHILSVKWGCNDNTNISVKEKSRC